MTAEVQRLANEVKRLNREQLEEFLSWLFDYELAEWDEWDQQIARDSAPGGRLSGVLDRVRRDITAGRTKPLDEFLDNS